MKKIFILLALLNTALLAQTPLTDPRDNKTANQLDENTRSKIDIITVVNQNANELKITYIE